MNRSSRSVVDFTSIAGESRIFPAPLDQRTVLESPEILGKNVGLTTRSQHGEELC